MNGFHPYYSCNSLFTKQSIGEYKVLSFSEYKHILESKLQQLFVPYLNEIKQFTELDKKSGIKIRLIFLHLVAYYHANALI